MKRYILVVGDPIDGLTFFGPADDVEDLTTMAEHVRDIRNDTWWIAELQPMT